MFNQKFILKIIIVIKGHKRQYFFLIYKLELSPSIFRPLRAEILLIIFLITYNFGP